MIVGKMKYFFHDGPMDEQLVGLVVDYSGRKWLVLRWFEYQSTRISKPERMVCLDSLQYDAHGEDGGLPFYALNRSLPREILAPEISPQIEEKYCIGYQAPLQLDSLEVARHLERCRNFE